VGNRFHLIIPLHQSNRIASSIRTSISQARILLHPPAGPADFVLRGEFVERGSPQILPEQTHLPPAQVSMTAFLRLYIVNALFVNSSHGKCPLVMPARVDFPRSRKIPLAQALLAQIFPTRAMAGPPPACSRLPASARALLAWLFPCSGRFFPARVDFPLFAPARPVTAHCPRDPPAPCSCLPSLGGGAQPKAEIHANRPTCPRTPSTCQITQKMCEKVSDGGCGRQHPELP
jgi:hypothetical protein